MKQLIINADDFGISLPVNKAINNCFKKGVLDSATIMVNMPHAYDAAVISLESKLPVGLHFNLTLGVPISPLKQVETLVNADGVFYNRREFIKRYLLKKIKLQHVEIEFNAQLKKFSDLKLSLDHIDSHQHIHILPNIFDMVAAYCKKNSAPLRMVRPYKSYNQSLKKKLKVKILSFCSERNFKKWENDIEMNPYLVSIFDILPENTNLTFEMYKRLLSELPSTTTEFMIHPIVSNTDISAKKLTRISHISEQEYSIVMSKEFLVLLEDLKLKRTLYSNM